MDNYSMYALSSPLRQKKKSLRYKKTKTANNLIHLCSVQTTNN